MSRIVILPKEEDQSDFEDICVDVTEYADFVQKRTGLAGRDLFEATRAAYSKIGWAPWEILTWKPR